MRLGRVFGVVPERKLGKVEAMMRALHRYASHAGDSPPVKKVSSSEWRLRHVHQHVLVGHAGISVGGIGFWLRPLSAGGSPPAVIRRLPRFWPGSTAPDEKREIRAPAKSQKVLFDGGSTAPCRFLAEFVDSRIESPPSQTGKFFSYPGRIVGRRPLRVWL